MQRDLQRYELEVGKPGRCQNSHQADDAEHRHVHCLANRSDGDCPQWVESRHSVVGRRGSDQRQIRLAIRPPKIDNVRAAIPRNNHIKSKVRYAASRASSGLSDK